MEVSRIKKARAKLWENREYEFVFWQDYSYLKLRNMWYFKSRKYKETVYYNDVIIMADTETSKSFYDNEYNYQYSDEYDTILSFVKRFSLKYLKSYNEVATYQEFRSEGFNIKKNNKYSADVLYQELNDYYPYLFPDDVINDIDQLQLIYDYLSKYNPKHYKKRINNNYVVAWTISIRAFNKNICTLWGRKPSEFVECLDRIQNYLPGDRTSIYFHNLTYDYTFLRQFLFKTFGFPIKQLNTKPRYPIMIEFPNGIILKDSLILAQRSLDKWAQDLNVENQKAVGKWDYDKIRSQEEDYTADELEYIEHDTLAGVECLQATMDTLGKNIASMPYTATGIPRENVRIKGKEAGYKENFLRMCLDYDQYIKMTYVYHGGYTHGNRHLLGIKINYPVYCYDFASSYPYCMLAYKFPMEKFVKIDACSIEHILKNADDRAYIFKLVMVRPRLKDDNIPMPALQYSKCVKSINNIDDNGRILCADYVEIYLNEIDLEIIAKQYDYDEAFCVEVETAKKDYLPRWFTDYVYKCFEDKTTLKGGDPVLYAIAKSKLNSLYGLCVTKSIKDNWQEDFETYEYEVKPEGTPEEEYEKYLNNRNNILPYQWGVWVTSYAFRNLFALGECFNTWLYSDTDSCYGTLPDEKKIDKYNKNCIKLIKQRGYSGVTHNGKIYHLGVAEHEPDEDEYEEFKFVGAKRYCGRRAYDHKLKITIAGVPKKTGVKCLDDNIDNFRCGKVFSGHITGKKTHVYLVEDGIKYKNGIEYADSIDLIPCDYLLSQVSYMDWKYLFEAEGVSYNVEESE